jgi:hypothetical protein
MHIFLGISTIVNSFENGYNWVEFSSQFHAHLVKCTIVLVPWPIQKVKKVLFGLILELLNGESPQAFFDLSKGNRQATAAQKEKKCLACKRNHALRCDCHRLAEEAIEGHPQWQCVMCTPSSSFLIIIPRGLSSALLCHI